jgi:hypothetical protein
MTSAAAVYCLMKSAAMAAMATIPPGGDHGTTAEAVQEPPGNGARHQHTHTHQPGDESDLCRRTAGLLQVHRQEQEQGGGRAE